MDAIREQVESLWAEAYEIWLSGGWAMIAIAVIALVMFSVGVSTFFKLRRTGYRSVPERTWRRWIDRPHEGHGPIGRLVKLAMRAESVPQAATAFEELKTSETVPFERDLRVMKVCVNAAPLVGLLGTVTGMLSTFGALATGGGGDKTMGMVAEGISEALITTETGLVIALPGLFFQYLLGRQFEHYKAFLTHLENVCTQAIFLRQGVERKHVARRAAASKVAQAILQRVRAQAARVGASDPAPILQLQAE